MEVNEVNNMKYNVIETIEKPSLVISQDYCNSLTKDAYFQFKKRSETGSICSWSVTDGLSIGTSIEFRVGLPFFGTKFKEEINMTFSKTESQTTTHLDAWEIDNYIPVPALTYVDATFTVTETDYSCTWDADLVFSGCANVWFKDKINNHWEWWYTADEIYGQYPGFECWLEPGVEDDCRRSFCKYKSKGTYYGIGGARSHLTTDSGPCIKAEDAESIVA